MEPYPLCAWQAYLYDFTSSVQLKETLFLGVKVVKTRSISGDNFDGEKNIFHQFSGEIPNGFPSQIIYSFG